VIGLGLMGPDRETRRGEPDNGDNRRQQVF